MTDRPPPWVFLLIALPQGVFFGFSGTAMPWMLRNADVAVEQIATASAVINNLPSIFGFLWAPLVDIGRHRRLWLIGGAGSSAVALLAGMLLPLPSGLTAMIIVLSLGGVLNTFCSSAAGGLMAATLHSGDRGLASGFYQAGNVGGAAIGGGVTLLLLQNGSVAMAAIATGLMIFLPALAVLAIREPDIAQSHIVRLLRAALIEMLRNPRTRQAIVILVAPVGACAFAYLFTAVSVDYSASPGFVTAITGFGGGLVTTLGSLIGGVICQHVERRRANLLVGTLSALVAVGMILGPLSPSTYGVGTVLYSLTAGMCYTAYVALMLEVVGPDRGTGATRFAILTAVANIPDSYMTWLDGKGYGWFGPNGLLGVDALATLVSAAALYAWIRRDKTEPAIAVAEAVS